MEPDVPPTAQAEGGAAGRWQAHSLLFAGLSAAAYAVSYAFYAVLARNLPVAEFGIAGVFIAVTGVVALLSGSLILAVGREVSKAPAGRSPASVRAAALGPLKWLTRLCAVGGLALLPFAPMPGLVLLTAAIIPIRDVHCGLLNGLRLNLKFGVVLLTEAFVRFVGAFATLLVPSAVIALLAWLLSYAAGLLLAFLLLPSAARQGAQPAPFWTGMSEALGVRMPQVAFLNIDVILIPVILGLRAEIGLYVAAAILSRVPFYLVTAHAIGELPNLVREQGRGPAAGRVALIGAFGAGAMVAVLLGAPALALETAFGPGYGAGAPLLLILSLTGFLLVQLNSVAYILIASGGAHRAAVVIGGGVVAEVGLIFVWGASGGAQGVATASAVAAIAALFGLIALHLLRRRGRKQPIGGSATRVQ